MEIEAKFSVPDENTFLKLLKTTTLAGCSLGTMREYAVHDRYVDTPDGAFRTKGLACRLRKEGDRFFATIKGPATVSGAVHRRAEDEVELQGLLPPREWPLSRARDLALSVIGNQSLSTLFEVEQVRYCRIVREGDRTVAQHSLDRVRLCRGSLHRSVLLELELELLPGGRQEDLDRLISEVRDVWCLAPQGLSKFERGLEAFNLRSVKESLDQVGENLRLAPRERMLIEQLSHEREVVARRARVLLAWDDGLSRDAISERASLSPRRVNYWLNAFRRQRLQIFPDWVLEKHSEAYPLDASPIQNPRRMVSILVPEQARKGEGGAAATVVLPERPGIEADDPMSEAGRKVFSFHFLRMLYNEPGTRLGEDIEALHDMRVASRRMRAAFRVFDGYYKPEAVRRYVRGLRRTRRALGPVRDLDVFRAKTLAYQESLSEAQRGGLSRFVDLLEARRRDARQRMLAYLDSKKHRRFVEAFADFVVTTGMESLPVAPDGDGPIPYRVRHVAPVAVYERLAAVRAFDEWVTVPDPPLSRLHALRIACKGLRYSLEFFREVLGPDTGALVKIVVVVQDHLGELQDAVVASEILREYLGQDTGELTLRQGDGSVRNPGVEAYLASKQSELQHLVATFPDVWENLTSIEFSRMIAGAIAVL